MANKRSRTWNAKLNMLSSLGLQVITAISGLILPRLIIPTYGSDLNGLIVSITQFLSYISLLEAGVGSVFRSSLYRPIANNDMQKVSGIINEQKRFYRKIGIAFIVYVVLLCAFYPLIVKTNLGIEFVIALILILSVGTFLEYFVSLPYQSLIIADQMIRIVYFLSSAVLICNVISTVVLINLGVSILVVKLATCIIALLKPLVYVWYTKTHYKLESSAEPDKSSLNQRWSGMVHHFSYYVHRNTDIVLLSVFVGTVQVSIYSIYLAVVIGIENIITTISTGIGASIGNMLADGNKEVINKTIDIFEFVQISITTILYSITGLMLIPFIQIYTLNMKDANYIEPLFGYLLIIAEAIYCIRCVYSTITMNGNKFKETQFGAVLEGVINLGLSLLLIFAFKTDSGKLMAIAIGTICGMSARLIYEIVYLKKDLLFRPVNKVGKCLIINIIVAVLGIITCTQLVNYNCDTVLNWIEKGLFTTVIVTIEACLVYFIADRKLFLASFKKLVKRT